MATNAAAMLEEPTGFNIDFFFYACLYYKSELINGEYAALFYITPSFPWSIL